MQSRGSRDGVAHHIGTRLETFEREVIKDFAQLFKGASETN